MAKDKENTLIKERSINDLIKELGDFKLPVSVPEKIKRRPTGVLSLDVALHGGLPEGKGVMIFGDTKMGKTTLNMFIAREMLAQGKTVAWLDIENSFDPAYAHMMNFDFQTYIDTKKFIYFRFADKTAVAERWLDAITMMIASGEIDLIIMDSLAAVPTGTEMNSSAEKANVATLARILTPWVRVIIPLLEKHGTTLLVINQERVVIGSSVPMPNTFPGGKAIGHFMSIILQMRNPIYDYKKDGTLGKMTLRYVMRKTKVFRPPSTKEEFTLDINYDGEYCELDFVGEIVTAATNFGILRNKEGERWTKNVAFYNGQSLGNGEKQIRKTLEENNELLMQLSEEVFACIKEGKSYESGPTGSSEDELQGTGVYEGEDDQPSDDSPFSDV